MTISIDGIRNMMDYPAFEYIYPELPSPEKRAGKPRKKVRRHPVRQLLFGVALTGISACGFSYGVTHNNLSYMLSVYPLILGVAVATDAGFDLHKKYRRKQYELSELRERDQNCSWN